jgi:signal transduction histidine kinase
MLPNCERWVRIKDLSEYVSISIHNWGTIPEDVRYTFFEKYASSGKKSGVGLGTYIVQLVVKAHDGEITMNSSDDEGTDISIILPYSKVLEAE